MMDPIAKASGKSSSSAAESEQSRKACADCGTTRTPLWRGGPAGPKSLCNACGIRSRKKRRSVVVERRSKGGSSSNNGGGNEGKMGEKRLKWRFMAIGRGELKQKRKMEGEEEEEEAAVLLMALSYGSVVYA